MRKLVMTKSADDVNPVIRLIDDVDIVDIECERYGTRCGTRWN
jgi:hypothetical protein